MSVQREIIKTIDQMVDGAIGDKLSLLSSDVASIVSAISNNLYTVHINGQTYNVPCGTNITPAVGSAVWVHIPNGKIKDAYILAYKKT